MEHPPIWQDDNPTQFASTSPWPMATPPKKSKNIVLSIFLGMAIGFIVVGITVVTVISMQRILPLITPKPTQTPTSSLLSVSSVRGNHF